MAKIKKIVGVNTGWFLTRRESFEEININSKRSLLDFDIVLINGSDVNKSYLEDSFVFEFKPLLNSEQSIKISSDYSFISRQLDDILVQGKNVYVIVGENLGCYKKKVSSNYNDRHNVEWVAPYSFLPVTWTISAESIRGNQFDLVDASYKAFFEKFKSELEYRASIRVQTLHSILNISGTSRIVCGSIPVRIGKIIFLPYFRFLNAADNSQKINDFLDWLIEFDESLKKGKEFEEFPKWIDDYNILSESEDMVQLQKFEKEKIELQRRIDAQNERLALFKKYKGLFTSTGEQLENIIKEVFGEMGFQVFPTEKGRTDVIAKYGDTDVVMEIKGLTKSAAEKNAAQLEKWASDFIDKNEKSAKPLLVVNAFRELPLEQRTEAAFPNQMQSYSKSRNHCLMTTTQLLCLFIEITENPECKDERINELLTTVGVYNRYPDYTKFIKKVK